MYFSQSKKNKTNKFLSVPLNLTFYVKKIVFYMRGLKNNFIVRCFATFAMMGNKCRHNCSKIKTLNVSLYVLYQTCAGVNKKLWIEMDRASRNGLKDCMNTKTEKGKQILSAYGVCVKKDLYLQHLRPFNTTFQGQLSRWFQSVKKTQNSGVMLYIV